MHTGCLLFDRLLFQRVSKSPLKLSVCVFFVSILLDQNFIPFELDLAIFLWTFSAFSAALTLRLAILGAGGASSVTGTSIDVILCAV